MIPKDIYSSRSPLIALSRLSLYIFIFAWTSFILYVFLLVKPDDIPSLIKYFLSTEADGIKFRALILFSPLFFTIISFLMNERDEYIKELISTQSNLERMVDERTLELTNEILEREKLSISLRLLEKAFLTTTTGITFSDTDRIIRFINKADAEMHGYEKDELLGKNIHVFAPKELWHSSNMWRYFLSSMQPA